MRNTDRHGTLPLIVEQDGISIVSIDELGRLRIFPASTKFPWIYREALEVGWDPEGGFLFSPRPREWSYARWFLQILAAAREQGCALQITPGTQWQDIDTTTRLRILQAYESISHE